MEAWLKSLHLEQYALPLAAAGFISLENCSLITEPDLIQLDILPGHRKRILMNLPVPSPAKPPPRYDEDESVYENVSILSHLRQRPVSADVFVPVSDNGWGDAVYDVPKPVEPPVAVISDYVYDVLPPRSKASVADEEDGDLYVNFHDLNAAEDVSAQPPLPPKTTSFLKRQSITDEIFGIATASGAEASTTLDLQNPAVVDLPSGKRPVPAPRNVAKSLKNMPLGVSVDTALGGEKPEKMPKPTPKPRLRRGKSTNLSQACDISSIDSLPADGTEQELKRASNTFDDAFQVIEDNTLTKTERHLESEDYKVTFESPQEVLSPDKEIPSEFEEQLYDPMGTSSEIQAALSSSEAEKVAVIVPETYDDINNDSLSAPVTSDGINSDSLSTPETSDGINNDSLSAPDNIKSDAAYGAVWVMRSGRLTEEGDPEPGLQPVLQPMIAPVLKPVEPTVLQSTSKNDSPPPHTRVPPTTTDSVLKAKDNLDSDVKANVNKLKLQLNLPPETTDTEDAPGVFGMDHILWAQFSPCSRESIISFCEPPPNFSPPPLPPGVVPPSIIQPTTTQLSPIPLKAQKPVSGPPLIQPLSHTTSTIPTTSTSCVAPPVIPPRTTKNYPVKPDSTITTSTATATYTSEENQMSQLLSSNSSDTSATLQTQVPTIPDQACRLASPVFYDTPAPASGPLTCSSLASEENEYSEVGSASAHSRDSTISFSDLASKRADRYPHDNSISSSIGACASEKECPSTPARSTSTSSMKSQSSSHQENIYVDSPVMTPLPPVPPPRNSPKYLSRQDSLISATSFNSNLDQQVSRNFADLESDDTLSDGGEFLESDLRPPHPATPQTTIPIVPAQANSIRERRGYLYKLPSAQSRRNQKRLGWRKRWVTFDGEELIYFSDEKSAISKRIIPLNTIVNVEQQIKGASSVLKRVSEMGDVHPYEFKLTTIDRIYRFAADDGDDLTMWTSILMRGIIDSRPACEEGGCMASPDKQGFLRMEGLKGRQYLAIQKDKFCYYNTLSDYKVGTPIHRVDLKLASVKDAGKGKLLLTTPRVSFGLLCEGEAELLSWKEAFEEGIAEGLGDNTILKEVYENQNNCLCADCGTPDPHWASINMGITVCKQCAGIHRMLSTPRSKIRSLRMDFRVWTPTLIQMLQKIGNDNSNNYWEWNSTEDDRIDSDADMSSREEYILAKYRDKRFFRFHPLRADTPALNEALCKSVQYGDILETLQALYSGADIQCTSSAYGSQKETPLQLARKTNQTLQAEFLFQNGAESVGQCHVTRTSTDVTDGLCHLQTVSMKGYLHKLQSNLREYNRRWFKLERGVFAYFDHDKSVQIKDSIERKEIMSVSATSDDKFEYGFEVVTSKTGSRVYIMATDTEEERHHWMVKIAKSFAPLPSESLDKIKGLDRGGLIFLREGVSTDWQMTWMHIKKKTLYIYKKDEQKFDEIDLRKVTGMKTLQRTDLCLETFDDGPPFVIDLPNRALYIQGDTRSETEAWYKLIKKVCTGVSSYLVDLQLTSDNVPVIVDKCINFVSAHGMRMEGLYRLNGQHSKVGLLLEEFQSNAQNVFLSLDMYQVHDVATAFKRMFRTLDEPLLTNSLFSKWIATSNMMEDGPKLQWYKYLLGELPTVHYSTLKRVIVHLARVASFEEENKMSEVNLASIFGPILMKVDKDLSVLAGGYGSTTQEIAVCLDLIANHKWLFEVKDDELEHERKIQEALEKIERASRESQSQATDLLVGVYIKSREGDVITLKVPATMTAQEVLNFVESKAGLDHGLHWGIYEVICQNQLERPLHYMEPVLEVNLRWSTWPEEFSKDNYLVVKPNIVIEKVKQVFDPHFSLFNEFKFSEKKAFKKFYFEFSKCKLSYQKDTRATNPIASWNIEELLLYTGIEHRRNPPTKWGITFVSITEKMVKSKDSPYFGHSISCLSEDEMYRWLAALLHAQHPRGLVPEGMTLPTILGDDLPLPRVQIDEGGRPDGSRPSKRSIFHKFKW